MIMYQFLLGYITLILTTSPAAASAQEDADYDCYNPKGELGHCIELLNCDVLFQILKTKPINFQEVKFLQKSTCGFIKGQPKVCCVPAGNKNDVQTGQGEASGSEPTTTTSTTTARPVTDNTKKNSTPTLELAFDSKQLTREGILRHPNLHLLPTTRTCGQSLSTDRIIGGKTAGLGAYPWMVLLAFKEEGEEPQLACGGTLISDRYVLTAAHCVSHLPPGFKLSFIRIGEYDQTQEIDCVDDICADAVQDIGIEEILYKNYDVTKKKENDIALIRLNHTARFGPFVAPICLPHCIDVDSAKGTANITRLVVAGWGRTIVGSEKGADILQELAVPIISNQECNAYYTKRVRLGPVDDSRFCAGGEANKDSCQGDSGGPLQQIVPISNLRNSPRMFQFGIVSMGPARCGSKDQPALYTKVSHYIPWILDNLKP